MDHQLRGVIGLRLEQHGVHVGMRRHAAGHGLERLRPADFPAVHGDGGIVRHVLRLERQNLEPRLASARQMPATSTDLPTSDPVPCTINAPMLLPSTQTR
jgi:hypothetical protein